MVNDSRCLTKDWLTWLLGGGILLALLLGVWPTSSHPSSKKIVSVIPQGKEKREICSAENITIQTNCVCPPVEAGESFPGEEHQFTKACVEWAKNQRELRALEADEQACSQGNQEACFRAGKTLLYGIEGRLEPDAGLGMVLMEQACRYAPQKSLEEYGYNQGEICSFVAGIYKSGIENKDGTEQFARNQGKAVEMYQLVCNEQRQDVGACVELAGLYRSEPELAGESKRASLYQARACLAEVAEQAEFDRCVLENRGCSRRIFGVCKDLVGGGL